MNELFSYAMTFVGLPYVIGGQHPSVGYDCSGVATEILIAGGALKHGTDLSAQGLYDHFKQNQCEKIDQGSLVFFGKSFSQVSHVGWAISDFLMIESGGGDFSTTDVSKAILKGAFVRVRPIGYRRDFLASVKPRYGWER